eukprot:GFUD01022345.1.p1 GENE.GFUD01022345.1~~GFUD01022345.1.p1  ORF type:complete len:147 (-),score=43.00 GFUD01022345.1:87-527(-)
MSLIVKASRLFKHSHVLSSPLQHTALTLPRHTPLLVCERGAKVKAAPGAKAGKGGGKGGAMQKAILDVETDATKLVTQVCGLNYKLEDDPVMVRPDSEYPDWLWTLDVKRPLPLLEERDPNTKEYWMQVQRDMRRARNKLMKLKKN